MKKLNFIFTIAILVAPLLVGATASSTIKYLSPGPSVNPGSTVTFYVSTTGLTNPVFNLLDSFPNSTIGGGNINSSGNFSWTPGQSDFGTHVISVNVSDGYGNISTVSQQIVVGQAPTVLIQSVSPGNVLNYGSTASFSVLATGFVYPMFSIGDQFTGTLNNPSTVTSSNIDANGNFQWTPTAKDVGSHNITVNVIDNFGHNASGSINFLVNSNTTIIIQSSMLTSTVNPGQNVSFDVYVNGINYPSFSVRDDFSGSTVRSNALNSSGNFSWTPTSADLGTHDITITATDNAGHTATAVKTFTVQTTGASISGLSPSAFIPVGTAVAFNVPVSGFTTPSFNLSDSFTGSSILPGMINNAGFFNWTPVAYDVGVHNIKIDVIDNLGHKASTNVVLNIFRTNEEAQIAQLKNEIAVRSKATAPATPATPTATPASSAYKFSTYLTIGSTGKAVTELQKKLTAEKVYSGPITGKFGAQTFAGVKAFQKKYKITQLGVVGPATRAQLNK